MLKNKPETTQEQTEQVQLLRSFKEANQLASFLETDMVKLPLQYLPSQYRCFKIPKPNGKFRLIEAPHTALKATQRCINTLLQSLYNQYIPECSYGFIYNLPTLRKKEKRHIVSHAKQHRNAKYMINIDLKDFFHQISVEKINKTLREGPYYLQPEIASLISKICCLNSRLPMGAPTSPVLSNICLLNLDEQLTTWANKNNILYTRFADDLTFSSSKKINTSSFIFIQETLSQQSLNINPSKFKQFNHNDKKEVTGLCIGKKVTISKKFKLEVIKDIDYFKDLNTHRYHYQTLYADENEKRTSVLKFARQAIEGKLNFISFVMGKHNKVYVHLKEKYRTAKKMNGGISAHGYHLIQSAK